MYFLQTHPWTFSSILALLSFSFPLAQALWLKIEELTTKDAQLKEQCDDSVVQLNQLKVTLQQGRERNRGTERSRRKEGKKAEILRLENIF